MIIIDDADRPIANNIRGILAIAGKHITPGYWKDPDRDKEAFFIHNNTRFYRTGDVFYKDEEGDILFCGRTDSQVKVQGFRIELGEIEYHVREFLSGPIDRPNTFIPQLQTKRVFDYNLAVDGCRQILWGMFKKMLIADHVATAVDTAWNNISETSGITLVFIDFLFSIQIYADFSVYSDMAIGVGKLLGFRVTKNFNYPYFARNIAEFWRNWHMSLTSWLTDYVFTPLNFNFRYFQF
jgi:hypothetical protein